jgi:hypothetical protein
MPFKMVNGLRVTLDLSQSAKISNLRHMTKSTRTDALFTVKPLSSLQLLEEVK